MRYPTLMVLGGALCLATATLAVPDDVVQQPDRGGVDVAAELDRFLDAQPGTRLYWLGDRITRVYGKPFSTGADPAESAASFLNEHAGIFGLDADDFVPLGDDWLLPHVQPVAPDGNGGFRFTMYSYQQVRDGVPVFRGIVKLLVRNEAGSPLVLASADLRDIGGFSAPANAMQPDLDAINAAGELVIGDHAHIARGGPMLVVWAGSDLQTAEPRLAWQAYVHGHAAEEFLVVVDAETGEMLYNEDVICTIEVDGNVQGRVSDGIGAEQCADEIFKPMPYLQVTGGGDTTFTDVDGNFTLDVPATPVSVSASYDGLWFDVTNFGPGGDDTESATAPPGLIEFNAANTDPIIRAQANCYLESNVIRDYVLEFSPAYPTLQNPNFTVNANRTDGPCPGNAWYSSGGPSINFCQAGGGAPNTAWTSVIYHEYGHHLVQAAGSGQGAYGEGSGDTMSTLILDSPLLGWGFFGNCTSALRNADNTLQYPCSGGIHFCGQVLSGCVWETRNELLITNPSTYLDIVSDLYINSILLHTGSGIDPSITIDFLTLDDDDNEILNGTPHYQEIATGFGEHNMDAPPLAILGFEFPGGLPDLVAPSGGTSVPVEVVGVTGVPEPGTAVLHVSFSGPGGPFQQFPLSEDAPNSYTASFPGDDCGSQLHYYFSAESTGGQTQTFPSGAPLDTLTAVAATDLTPVFTDDFETNTGWTVSTNAGDGGWNRGIPIPHSTCDRGNPNADADGSGQCYLTDNSSANGCNSDVDDGSTVLTSPVLNAMGDSTYVRYSRWFSNNFGDGPFSDTFLVEVSDNGGLNWTTLEAVGPDGIEVQGGWYDKEFRISDFVENTGAFRIRFTASDVDPQSVVEAAIDGFALIEYECDEPDPCPEDLDGDGEVGVPDLIALITAWGTNDPDADFDGNGDVDVLDLVALISAWGTCP